MLLGDEELIELLSLHRNSSWQSPDPEEIHQAVITQYGIAQFGDKFLFELKTLV